MQNMLHILTVRLILTFTCSGAGKSQLAMQFALTAQLPQKFGGLDAGSCYITTQARLPTQRLVQLSENNSLLSSLNCNLSNIHTQLVTTFDQLIHILNSTLPLLLDGNSTDRRRQIKLLIIDTITTILPDEGSSAKRRLLDRSKAIAELGVILHKIASKYRIAVITLNEVTDVFVSDAIQQRAPPNDISYREQKRIFSVQGAADQSRGNMSKKEAALGLIWANQVNVRIVLTRPSHEIAADGSCQGMNAGAYGIGHNHSNSEDTMRNMCHPEAPTIRHLSVVFSTISSPSTADYTITPKGVVLLSEEEDSSIIDF